jgi:predicted O-methyltransferase YrrM
MKIYGLVKLPVQTKKERKIFKAIYNLTPNNKKVSVFEWGSGFSTLYYAHYLKDNGIDFEWHAIDNNRDWHEKVVMLVKQANFQSNIKLYLEEFKPFWEKSGWGPVAPPCGKFAPSSENEKKYVDYPRLLGKKFDVIVVDARFRKRCIQVALKALQPDGIVILHDAQKKQYHEGLESYPTRRFIDSGKWYPLQEEPNRIWIGSLINHPIFDKLKSFK